MAHSLSAQKRVRQNLKRNARNRWRKRLMREAVKEFADKIAHGTLDEASSALKKAAQVIDRTAQKGTIHKNQAARRKSRMSAKVKARKVAGQISAPPKK
ncbi:MAG: 30S ribosomal protein S20 [Planctomycetaceae bacterium]|jgi:small subunit ribosomal protein S20|nr:30S ribosomal protein S20 [Planctomycetaceae bacterium]